MYCLKKYSFYRYFIGTSSKDILHLLAFQRGISRGTFHTAVRLLRCGCTQWRLYWLAYVVFCHHTIKQEFENVGGFYCLCSIVCLSQNLRFIAMKLDVYYTST